MDYTITLETLESFWMAFSRCFEHRVGAWAILYPWLRLVVLGIAQRSQEDALFTLSQLLRIPYRWITRVLYRPLKVSQML